MKTLHQAAIDSEVLKAEDLKTRAAAFDYWKLHGPDDDFVHVTCHLLAGRTDAQKVRLAESLRQSASSIAPDVISISVNIVDMNPVAYKKRLLPSR